MADQINNHKRKENSEVNAVLFEIIAGILITGIACQAAIVWFVTDKGGFSLGLWLGIITAVFYVISIWHSTGQYLYMGAGAGSLAKKHVMLRYFIVAVILIIAALTDKIQLLAVFLGIISVKAGTLLQPHIRKLYRKNTQDNY